VEKKRIYYGLSLVVLSFLSNQAHAQQDPQYTHYMYNHSNINPAYAGSTEGLQLFGLYRTQWVGLDGAPKTATLSATTPLGTSGLGLGVNLKDLQSKLLEWSYEYPNSRSIKHQLGKYWTSLVSSILLC